MPRSIILYLVSTTNQRPAIRLRRPGSSFHAVDMRKSSSTHLATKCGLVERETRFVISGNSEVGCKKCNQEAA